MNKWILMTLALAASTGLASLDAEAARLGGGRSFGAQRPAVTQRQAAPPATQAAPAAPAATPQPAGNRWLAPLAGLAAGLGLGWLFANGGFSGVMGTLLMGMLVFAGVMLLMRLFMRPRAEPQPASVHYAGMMGQETVAAPPPSQPMPMVGDAPDFRSQFRPNIPAGFDSTGFVKQAKLNFIRLQQANDEGDLETLRDMATEEMLATLKADIEARGGAKQRTDVVTLSADLLEVVTEGGMHWASVRFAGMLREARDVAAGPFEEVWNLQKPVAGGAGWLLAGIQQIELA